jgi:3-phosphoshikimate 1-carboxyvinyltransferase
MKEFGAHIEVVSSNIIKVNPKNYTSGTYTVESDWSGASYWYAFVALSEDARVLLKGLREESFQGDQKVSKMMEYFGVKTSFDNEGVLIEKTSQKEVDALDFTDNPDLAQTFALICAVLRREITFTGLESLRIKETDRIAALQNELNKIGANLIETKTGQWKVVGARPDFESIKSLEIETYDDHRMAMAFAPLATLMDVTIKEPQVVNKSFPNFWNEMENAGFMLEMEA